MGSAQAFLYLKMLMCIGTRSVEQHVGPARHALGFNWIRQGFMQDSYKDGRRRIQTQAWPISLSGGTLWSAAVAKALHPKGEARGPPG